MADDIGEQMENPNTPARKGALTARADAARSLFKAAGVAVDEKEPECWVVRASGESAALWLFWPGTGAFRTERGDRAGYGPMRLIAAIKDSAR